MLITLMLLSIQRERDPESGEGNGKSVQNLREGIYRKVCIHTHI